MARSFNGTSDYIERTGLSTLNSPLTISAWFKASSLAAQMQIVSVGTGVEADYALLVRTTGAIRARHAEASGLADSSTSAGTVSTGAWNHGAAVFASTTSRTVYLNGTAATTATNSIASANATQVNIGTRYIASSRADFFNGSIGEVGVWNVALTQDEITSLSKGISPLLIRPQNLIDYVPLTGRYSPEIGLKGGSYTLTGTSTDDSPRILRPSIFTFALAPLRALTLTAAAAAFTLTGIAASLIPSNKTLTAAQASFTLTGNAATLSYSGASHTLTASPATFTHTGNNASLGRNAVIVDPATSYQTFKGWEATAQAGHEYLLPAETVEYPSTSYVNYKTALIEAMMDLGIDRLRLEARFDDVNTTGYDPDNAATAVQPTTAASGDWHYDRMTRAMDDIGTPLRNALMARGETLYINLCIVDFDATGYDAENDPDEYAFFVNKFVTHFYNTYGYLPDAIETILEPGSGQNSTNWTRAKVANNLVAAQALLASSGPTGAGSIPFIAPSLEDGSTTESWMNDMTTADSSWRTYADQVSYHRYTPPSNAALVSFRDIANAFGADTAMLEHIGASAGELYDDLISGHNVAWQQFTIAFPYTGWTDNGAEYFGVNTTTWAVTLNTRTKYLRQYFKYIRRGAVMKGVTNRSTTLLGVPFVNSNGAYVVPVKCTAAGTFDVLGLPAGTYGIRYTTGDGTSAPSAYDTALTTQTITAGGAVNVVMPAAGVVTIFDGDYRPAMPATVGTYSLTGNAATFVYGRKLTATQATFTLTGNAAGLNRGYSVTASQATFTHTGNAAGLTVQRSLTAANGSFTLTGNAAGLTAQRVIPATVGTFALTGNDATLTYGSVGSYSLTADQSAFTLTGNAAGLTAQRVITAANGSFTLTGNATGLTAQRVLTSAVGSFALTGNDAGLTYGSVGSYSLTATQATFTLNGQATAFRAARRLTATVDGFHSAQSMVVAGAGTGSVDGTYTYRGTFDAKPYYNLLGEPSNPVVSAISRSGGILAIYDAVGDVSYYAFGAFTYPSDATWQTFFGASPPPTVTKYDATALNYGRTMAAAQATFSLTGNTAGLTAQRVITAANGTFTVTGIAATLNYSGAPDTKMDATLSAAAVTIATVSNSAVTTLVVSDRV